MEIQWWQDPKSLLVTSQDTTRHNPFNCTGTDEQLWLGIKPSHKKYVTWTVLVTNKSYHLFHAFHLPCQMLRDLQGSSLLISLTPIGYYHYHPHLQNSNYGSERLSNLPSITGLATKRTGIGNQSVFLEAHDLNYNYPWPCANRSHILLFPICSLASS